MADKNLITQNIDGLDGKTGNPNYIAIQGRIDKMTLFHNQEESTATIVNTPWDSVDKTNLVESLLELFIIKQIPIEIVDPEPVDISYSNTTLHKMKASNILIWLNKECWN